ncbi:MAG TPA: VWA domain-containing protein [Polyangia bacterium]|jgi:hypothetical protein
MMPQTYSVRALCQGFLALAVCALAGGGRAVAAPSSPVTGYAVAIRLRGPVALVDVTRALAPAPGGRPDAAEALVDVTLPPHAALLSIAVKAPGGAGHWRALDRDDAGHARAAYADQLQARGLTALAEAPEAGTTHRVRVLWSPEAKQSGPLLRYRFTALLEPAGDRLRLRFPASSELSPQPAAVTVAAIDASDLALPGQRIAGTAHRTTIHGAGQAPARAAWEVSYLPRIDGTTVEQTNGAVAGMAATARLSSGHHALAIVAAARAGAKIDDPTSVLFLIDRSRSVGLPGLSAERDLARQLLEALPPDTSFDVLFFDRATKPLFGSPRSATSEALAALDAEMVPDRLANGTDLTAAWRAAGDCLRRATPAFAPRTLLVLITDGALSDPPGGDEWDRALGTTTGLHLSVATFLVRADDDEPPPPAARKALQTVVAARGGILRDISAGQIPDGVRAAVDALDRGGDLFAVQVSDGEEHRTVSAQLSPGDGASAIDRWPTRAPPVVLLRARRNGGETAVSLPTVPVPAAWLQPLLEKPNESSSGKVADPIAAAPWFLGGAHLAVLAETVAPVAEAAVAGDGRGSVDRAVVQNTLALAFMPRARACYQNRPAPTPAARDLSGRVRLAIDLVRGEVAAAHIESSTLGSPAIENCLRESAFALDVPRATRSDAPVTAIVNLVFRPRPAEKVHTAEDTFPIGNEIDLALEELRRFEQTKAPPPPDSR